MAVPKKAAERMQSGMKRMRPILEQQRTRDVSEADTVTLVKDLLSEVFGYDKYAELTGEMAIRGTFCDLAVRLEDKVVSIIEVKAIGITLNDRHIKQVVDYAANQGVEWIMLTNGIIWRFYNVIFEKPIDKQLIAEIDLLALDPRSEADLEKLYLFSKEGFNKGLHVALRDRQEATSRFLIAALLLDNASVLGMLRRELRRVVDINVSEEEIARVLRDEIIKRDALEGPAYESASVMVKQAERKTLRETKAGGVGGTANVDHPAVEPTAPAADEQPPLPASGS